MAENLFTDYPERVAQITKYSDIANLYLPLEEAFGEKDTFKDANEAMDFYLGVLTEVGKFAAKEVAPTAREIDEEGATFHNGEVKLPAALESHMKKLAELGFFGISIARKYGGMNLPRSIKLMLFEMLGQACPNTGLTAAAYSMAEVVQVWGTEEQKQLFLPKLITNEWRTSMALTEPDCGSDLGKLRSTGVRKGDLYVVNGNKRFITSGQAELSFALVRTDPSSTGLKGLSVIMVPKTFEGKENFKVTKIEDKVCLHASPTCELTFENSSGYLLGDEGNGFRVMTELMNGARVIMATLSIGIAMGARTEAMSYAKTRVTMGKPIVKHPMVADMFYEMDIETHGMRSLVAEAGIAYDRMVIAHAKQNTKEERKWKKRYLRLTPLTKYLCSERCIALARNALQIYGGYGVCREYPAERYWRETIIYPIYEGTSQIQSLMVLKDTLKDIADNSAGFLGSLAGAWAESKVSRDPIKAVLLEARNELNQGIRTVLTSILKDKFKSDLDALKQQNIQQFLKDFSLDLLSPKTDLTVPFLLAERFTRITCDYYTLKCMSDRTPTGDKEQEKWIMEYAALALPRMRMENTYMQSRLPSTLGFLKTLEV